MFIWHLILGGLAGWLAGQVMEGRGYGIVVDILLGLAGGVIGSVLGWVLHIPSFGYFVTSFLGAILLVWLARRLN